MVKFRFIERKNVPFSLFSISFSTILDGKPFFRPTQSPTKRPIFKSPGQDVETVVLQWFIPATKDQNNRLIVMRKSVVVELFREKKTADPESRAELINMLDRNRIIATMGALLSLCSNEYTVLGVHLDKVVVCHLRNGEMFNVVGLAEEERDGFSADL